MDTWNRLFSEPPGVSRLEKTLDQADESNLGFVERVEVCVPAAPKELSLKVRQERVVGTALYG